MESNDENIDSTEDSNSVSTDVKNDSTPVRERIHKRNTNIVFVSPNELEDWDIEESKPKPKKTPRTKSAKATPKAKIPKPTPKLSRKKRGRPKRKKLTNPWSSDVDDENAGLENELSDDEYFRRLEEASEVYGDSNEAVETVATENVELVEEYEEEEEEIYIGQMKTFDLNNSDLLNYIIAERENSLHINDPSKPEIILPPSSNDLKCPRDCVLQLLSIYETIIQYYKILRISPFKIEDFITAMITNENSNLLSELHISVLKLLLREDETANTSLCPLDQKDGVNLAFHLIDSMTWPELLRIYVKCIDCKSQKIHIADAYPFVSLYDRINVMTFLLDLFVFGANVRNEIAREELYHEDFCRVCHVSGEVLCCDSCSSVYHLQCLTPQLSSVPTSNWNCPICVRHKSGALLNCNFDGEKALVEHKKTPLGQDRFGNTYWFIARRLIIEPRNDNIHNLVDTILDRDDEKDFEPSYDNVSYFSTGGALDLVRSQLSREWETELYDVFDSLVDEMKTSMSVTADLTRRGMDKFSKMLTSDLKVFSVLEDEMKAYDDYMESKLEDIEEEESKLEEDKRSVDESKKCQLKTMTGQPVGVIEDQEGLLVRNIDGSTVRVRLSAKTRSNQLEEVATLYNCDMDDSTDEGSIAYRLGDEGDWRFYTNIFNTEFEALSKLQHQEEKDRKRILGNKYSLNETNEFQWYVSQQCNRAGWFNLPLSVNRPASDILGGPLNMLQCLRLTLQNMEAQMFSSFMCPAWKSERKNWLINIQRTRNAASLADFVAIFESAIRPCSLKKAWTNSLGFLYLDRITAAEREEEKRNKTLERKGVKPDTELVKTRNPGLLKHTIWKTKGEEYRRSSGDGWSWLNASLSFNTLKLNNHTASPVDSADRQAESGCGVLHKLLKLPIKTGQPIIRSSDEDLIDITASITNGDLRRNQISNDNALFDHLLTNRLSELDKARSDFDLDESKNKLIELTNQRNELRSKKEQLEEKLDILSKNYSKIIQWKTQQQNRKRMFPNYDQSFSNNGEKRMRYQNENSPFIGQYDGADDDDMSTEMTPQQPTTVMQPVMDHNNMGMANVNLKPIVINNANNIRGLCVLNIGQNTNNQAQNRFMLNQPQFKVVRLPNNQILRLVAPGPNQASTQIRKFAPGTPQYVIVNNMPTVAQSSIATTAAIQNGHLIYNPNNGMQTSIRIATPNNNQQQQYKRLLPMEPAMMQQKQFPNVTNNVQMPQNATCAYPNMMVGTSRMSTPIQGRRTMSKVSHNTDNRMVPITDSNDELMQRKEMDSLCNEIIGMEEQLDQLDKQISQLDSRIQQATMGVSETYKLCRPFIDTASKFDQDCDKFLPSRNSYKWPLESKQFIKSVFLYKTESLRPLVLSAGRIEVPGFDVEKKRLNNIFWPYPTSRPSFSTTWKYQVSRVVNCDDLDERIFDLAATEPLVDPDHEKLKNVGSSGLASLALCMKMLWYSLRWDDMLINWQSSGIPTSLTMSQGIFKETLVTGEIVERKIIGWKPLDKYCSQCSYLVTVCTTTSNADSPGSSRSRGRSSRRGRQRTTARYTDNDYFTDDGEIDSDDSDPNFIPGVSRTATKSRGRRQRNRNTEDYQTVKLPEKKFKEEWMDEDLLELWEVRDYLISIGWRRFIAQPNKNQSQLVSSIMNKREFQRTDIPRNNITMLANVVPLSGTIPINMDANKAIPVNIVIKPDQTDNKCVLSAPEKLNDQSLLKSENNIPPVKLEDKFLAKNESQVPKVESLPSKLIIESSSTAIKPVSVDIISPNHSIKPVPMPITDIREVSRSESQTTPRGGRSRGRGRGRGRGRPPRRSISSQSEDTKYDDVLLDMDASSVEITNRLNTTKQNLIDIETINALNKSDALKYEEDIKKESKKSKKHRKPQYKDESSEELTDREVETGSTSPAVDNQIVEDHQPINSTLLTTKLINHTKTSQPKRSNRSKRLKDYSDSAEDSDDTLGTIEQRSESIDQRSLTPDSIKKRKRKHSSDYSASPKRAIKSNKARKVEVEPEEDDDTEEKYCFCKKKDPTQKYIGCDYCENWYHFSCVQMTGKKVSAIDTWKCHVCEQKENEQIYCTCKTKYDPSKLYIGCDYCDEWYHPQCIGMTDSEANNYQGDYKCPSCKQSKKKSQKIDESTSSSSNHNIDYEKKVSPDVRRKLSELLNKMMKHKNAAPFLKPVDIKANPTYYQVVRYPMDLTTAKTNLDKMKYSTIGSFKLDMQKIFNACRTYFSETSKECQSADKLEAYFLTELREIY